MSNLIDEIAKAEENLSAAEARATEASTGHRGQTDLEFFVE